MKKFNKYMSLAAVALVGAGFASSCDTSKDNDFVSEYTGAPGIYFATTENTYLQLVEGQSTINFPVYRDVAGEAQTVAVSVTPVADYDVTDIYTFPSSVTFEAGSKVANFVIGYDISKAEMGVEQDYELTLDAESTPFATTTTVITLVNPAPWNYLGKGEYYDWFWGISDSSYGPASVDVYQQGLDENLFRVSNPYIALNGENSYFEFRVLQPGDVFLGVNVTESDLVGWNMVLCEFNPDYSDDLYFVFPGVFDGYDDQAAWAYNRVLDYQDNGLPGYIQMAGLYYMFNNGGWNYWNTPSVEIIFPGYVMQDTSLEVSYEGVLTDSSQSRSVLLNVELGSDITSARAAVAFGTSESALVQAIVDGTADYTTFSASGNVKVPFNNATETGNYIAAVVGYVDDEAKNYDSVTFLYISSESNYDPNEGWTSLGYIPYTDAFVCARTFLNGNPPFTYYVEIQQSQDDAGLYRVVNPYGPGSMWSDEEYNPYTAQYIYVDVTDPTRVTMPPSDQYFVIPYSDGTTDTLGGVWCMAEYYLANGYTSDQVYQAGLFGTMEDGVITFPAMSLLAYWEYSDDDEDTGYFQANFVLDYDIYVETNGEDYLLYDENGEPVAPFYLDLNEIEKEMPETQSVALAPKAISLPKSANMLKTRTFNRNLIKSNDFKAKREKKFGKNDLQKFQKAQ